jgi:uncharacterized protein YjiS (DUF1127 family)
MTITFPTETQASLVSTAFGAPWALVRSLRGWFVRRTQRAAIASLLDLDPSQLYDLGISSRDVREALGSKVRAGSLLAARRETHSMAAIRSDAARAQLFD